METYAPAVCEKEWVRKLKTTRFSAILAILCLFLAACGASPKEPETRRTFTVRTETPSGEEPELGAIPDAAVPLSDAPAPGVVLTPEAPGVAEERNNSAVIDFSNAADGYVMVKWTEDGDVRLKVLVKGPGGTSYQYNLRPDGRYEAFPLSDGSGEYTVGVYKNVSGKEYAAMLSATFPAALSDEFAPFIRPNQYVNFDAHSAAVARAAELCADAPDNLARVERVYTFVVQNTVYDTAKAESVKSGYLPDVDETLLSGRGICFDYASLMAAMLRSQGVPVKLVVGYTGEVYHAWLSVWSEAEGWIEGQIYFNGAEWKLMDPTFASTGRGSERMREYIGDAANYEAKYLY